MLTPRVTVRVSIKPYRGGDGAVAVSEDDKTNRHLSSCYVMMYQILFWGTTLPSLSSENTESQQLVMCSVHLQHTFKLRSL